ncbi:hypothetical protein ACYSNW_13595 [Enterococcus sp. LJL99]
MDKYIQKYRLLETINIDFLADISKSEDWDSFFYEMFELVSIEEKAEEFFIYNRDRLFFLKKQESMEIEIREAADFMDNSELEELVIIVNQKSNKNRSTLIPKLISYLKEKKIGYQLLSKNQKKFFPKDITEIISIDR